MFAPPLLYFLDRVSVTDSSYKSLLVFGLMTLLGEAAAFVGMCSIYLQGGMIGLEFFDVTPFLWIPVVILIITIYDFRRTLPAMRNEHQK
jgi:hypothetical protein